MDELGIARLSQLYRGYKFLSILELPNMPYLVVGRERLLPMGDYKVGRSELNNNIGRE